MTNKQRRKNDIATMDRREMEDKALSDHRNRNDLLTQERRFEADKTTDEKRTRNDEITANRREVKDEEECMTFAIVNSKNPIVATIN